MSAEGTVLSQLVKRAKDFIDSIQSRSSFSSSLDELGPAQTKINKQRASAGLTKGPPGDQRFLNPAFASSEESLEAEWTASSSSLQLLV